MNQVLKDNVYRLGNNHHVDHLAKLGGMDEEEHRVFMLLHKGLSDINIQADLNLSRKSYERIEKTVRIKLSLALFELINKSMDGQL